MNVLLGSHNQQQFCIHDIKLYTHTADAVFFLEVQTNISYTGCFFSVRLSGWRRGKTPRHVPCVQISGKSTRNLKQSVDSPAYTATQQVTVMPTATRPGSRPPHQLEKSATASCRRPITEHRASRRPSRCVMLLWFMRRKYRW